MRPKSKNASKMLENAMKTKDKREKSPKSCINEIIRNHPKHSLVVSLEPSIGPGSLEPSIGPGKSLQQRLGESCRPAEAVRGRFSVFTPGENPFSVPHPVLFSFGCG